MLQLQDRDHEITSLPFNGQPMSIVTVDSKLMKSIRVPWVNLESLQFIRPIQETASSVTKTASWYARHEVVESIFGKQLFLLHNSTKRLVARGWKGSQSILHENH